MKADTSHSDHALQAPHYHYLTTTVSNADLYLLLFAKHLSPDAFHVFLTLSPSPLPTAISSPFLGGFVPNKAQCGRLAESFCLSLQCLNILNFRELTLPRRFFLPFSTNACPSYPKSQYVFPI